VIPDGTTLSHEVGYLPFVDRPAVLTITLERGDMKFRDLILVMSILLFGYSTVSFLYLSNPTGDKTPPILKRAISDQVQQYNAAVRAGSQSDRCVEAGFVASAYIQTRDQANYQAWSGIRNSECKAAGISQ
jgi:hypothetical protein